MSISEDAISIVEPVTITDSMLISTNVPEADYLAWSSATTYAINARVIVVATHKIYESLQASNTNHDPLSSPTWWIEVSPTNRWKCFDVFNSSQTKYPANTPPNITYAIKPGQAIGALALLNMEGANLVSITVNDPVYGNVYSKTIDVRPLPYFSTWWHWFFGSRKLKGQDVVVNDIPTFPNATVTVSIDGNTTLALGLIVIGQQNLFSLGMKYGSKVGIQDYSRKETNDFGDTVFTKRAFAKRSSFEIFLESGEVDQLQNYLASIRAKPVLWIGTKDYESTTIFGFYKNFEILLSYPDHSECSLDIEGLT